MQQNAMRLSPKTNSMVDSSPLGSASTPACRRVPNNLRTWPARGLRQIFFFSPTSLGERAPLARSSLCNHAISHSLKTSLANIQASGFFWPNSLRFPLGQSKCPITAIFTCYGKLQFVRLGAWRHPMLRGLSQGTRNYPVP